MRIEQLQVDDLPKFMTFLNEHWQRGHVFTRDRRLFDWQHLDTSAGCYNFLIAFAASGEIDAILGYIPLWQFSKERDCRDFWLAIWKRRENCQDSTLGFLLLREFERRLQPRLLLSLGISDAAKRMYRILRFDMGTLSHYYVRNPDAPSCLMIGDPPSREPAVDVPQADFLAKIELGEVERILGDLERPGMPHKTPRYYLDRFGSHPTYKYDFLALRKGQVTSCVFVTRRATALGASCLRIVDVIGNVGALGGYQAWVNFLKADGLEYADCYNYGVSLEAFRIGGFALKSGDIVVPDYFAPFERRNVELAFACKSPKDRVPPVIIFKGDSDQDRPN